jgi:predicted nucleotidyltransferase
MMKRKINDPLVNEIAKRLKEEFKLSRLYLFGSRGRGDSNKDSDYDIVAVTPSSRFTREKRDIQARVALQDIPAAIDVFVFTEKEFEEARKEIGSLAETVTFEGKEIPFGNL